MENTPAVVEKELSLVPLSPIKEKSKLFLPIVEEAKAVVIKDADSYKAAADLRFRMLDRVTEWKEIMADSKEKAHAAHKAACDLENLVVKPLEAAVKQTLEPRMKVWRDEQDRLARVAQEKADREAREQAERDALERAAAAPTPVEADAIVEEAINNPPPPPPVQKTTIVEGLGSRDNWKARVTNKLALVKAIADGKFPLDWLEVNMVPLNSRAKADKSTMQIPGVEAWNDKGFSDNRR